MPEATQAGGYGGFLVTLKEERKQYTRVYLEMVYQQMMLEAVGMTLDMTLLLAVKQLKIVNGVNQCLYGSGSLGGTVFIKDDLLKMVRTIRVGDRTSLCHTC